MATTAVAMPIITSAAAHAAAIFHRAGPAAPPPGGAPGTLVGAVSSSAVVVVIVGAVFCSIAYLVLRGARPAETGSKPATAWRPGAFAGPGAPAGPGRPGAWTPTELEAEEPLEPLAPLPPRRRARALVLLSVWVTVVGAAAAALIGAATFLVAHAVDKALG